MNVKRTVSTALFVATMALPTSMVSTQAFAGGSDALAGKTVFIKMEAHHTPNHTTTGMDGKVISSDESGVLISSSTVDTWSMKGGSSDNKSYQATVFIPWGSVSYIKVK